jgi:predicted ATPase
VLHGRIVEALEALSAERLAEQVERLAHHAVPGQVWDKVLRYAHQAGTRAVERSAYAEAGIYFDQALGALAHLPESREMLEQAIALHWARYTTPVAARVPRAATGVQRADIIPRRAPGGAAPASAVGHPYGEYLVAGG